MPGAVARTSTFALANATFPYAMKIANLGVLRAIREDRALLSGLNVYKGNLICRPVADALKIECAGLEVLLN